MRKLALQTCSRTSARWLQTRAPSNVRTITPLRTSTQRFRTSSPAHPNRHVASLSTSATETMHMVFTCANCDTRSVKSFAKSSYERGVVLAQCPGCEKRHVIADHLGWFGPEKNVEEILAAKGESVRRVTDVDLEGAGLPLEIITGTPTGAEKE